MPTRTRQEIFNLAVRGLAAQGWKRSTDTILTGMCRYRGANGCRCALGQAIDDADYDPEMEGKLPGMTIRGSRILRAVGLDVSPESADWARALQHKHDMCDSPEAMRDAFFLFARSNDLTWPEDVPQC